MRIFGHRLAAKPSPWLFLRDFPRIGVYLRPYKGLAVLSLCFVGVGATVALLIPWPLALLIDGVLGNKPLPSLLGGLEGSDPYVLIGIAVGAGLFLTLVQNVLSVAENYVNTKLEQNMVLDLRSDMFKHAHRLSLAFHDRKRTGQLMYQINDQAASVGGITVAIPPLLQSIVTLIGMFVVVYLIEPTLALVSMGVVPFIYYSAGYYARRIQPKLLKVRELEAQSLSIVHEAMAMVRVIAAFGRERFEYDRFRKQGETAVTARVRLTVGQTLFSLAVTMTTALGSAAVLALGAHHVLKKNLTAGELLVVMGYIASLYKPLEQISLTVSSLQERFISMRGALSLLESEPDVVDSPAALKLERASGAVRFEDVAFSYSGRRRALRSISFEVPEGSRVAMVGPTGAGKSTILNLIPRFYDPQEGRIFLDGIDTTKIAIASLRDQISLVAQEPLLFSGPIKENIRYGRLNASIDEVREAAMAASANEFIEGLPQKYDTVIGERGAQLSGGERQRISVARAFLKDSPLLILDEPTSAVDSNTEQVILDALHRLMEGRTTFIVAHRLSTIQAADIILVINHGKIVERGNHEELISNGGLYQQLFDAQSGSRKQAAAGLSEDRLAAITTAIADGEDGVSRMAHQVLDDLGVAAQTVTKERING